eukprot:TRINITY_DN3323_c1_g1_i2.p1 TRINITY_DN3323_c1_g1~~TRINITY_DN3323_c1_g1_i2.p1  ORF type:complete len:210 (+),score=39.46 TRINITY_DN3323_c1_g1_i2:107-736(+)
MLKLILASAIGLAMSSNLPQWPEDDAFLDDFADDESEDSTMQGDMLLLQLNLKLHRHQKDQGAAKEIPTVAKRSSSDGVATPDVVPERAPGAHLHSKNDTAGHAGRSNVISETNRSATVSSVAPSSATAVAKMDASTLAADIHRSEVFDRMRQWFWKAEGDFVTGNPGICMLLLSLLSALLFLLARPQQPVAEKAATPSPRSVNGLICK